MKTKKLVVGVIVAAIATSCSVQQFGVNTKTQPFENGGKFFGEKTKGLDFKKSGDLHVVGINVKESNVEDLVTQLDAKKYTIETKSNLWLQLITTGILDYKVVKVIKRDE